MSWHNWEEPSRFEASPVSLYTVLDANRTNPVVCSCDPVEPVNFIGLTEYVLGLVKGPVIKGLGQAVDSPGYSGWTLPVSRDVGCEAVTLISVIMRTGQ